MSDNILPIVRFLIESRTLVALLAQAWVEEYPNIDGCTPTNPRHRAALQLGVKPHAPT